MALYTFTPQQRQRVKDHILNELGPDSISASDLNNMVDKHQRGYYIACLVHKIRRMRVNDLTRELDQHLSALSGADNDARDLLELETEALRVVIAMYESRLANFNYCGIREATAS